jgi:hypothetical protein
VPLGEVFDESLINRCADSVVLLYIDVSTDPFISDKSDLYLALPTHETRDTKLEP